MPEAENIFDFSIKMDSGHPRSVQIYSWLHKLIVAGDLPVGARILSSRELSRRIGCSRNTVLRAYDQLIAEGYLETQAGFATIVCPHQPDKKLADNLRRDPTSVRPEPVAPRLSAFGERLVELEKQVIDRRRPAFAESQPDVAEFPFDIWARITNRIWRRPAPDLLHGYDRLGYHGLRSAISRDLLPRRGFDAPAESVLITSGGSHAIELVSRFLLDPGDQVAVEDPGYLGWRVLSALGFDVVPIPLDNDGIRVDLIPQLAPRTKLIAVTPSHQMPTGVVMSARRRAELLDYAESSQAWVIEDDYDADFRYSGLPLSSLKARDNTDRVVYVGTFSKIIFPTLRLGYVVANSELIGRWSRARTFLDCFSSVPMQPVLAAFIDEGHYERYRRRLRRLYWRRQHRLIELTDQFLAGYIKLKPSDAGMHVLGELGENWPASLSDAEFALMADRVGITLRPLSDYYQLPLKRQGFIFGYGAVPEGVMEKEIMKIASILPP